MFYKAQMFTNFEKFMLKFILLFIALARQAAILPVVREITCIKKIQRCPCMFLESNQEFEKGLLHIWELILNVCFILNREPCIL